MAGTTDVNLGRIGFTCQKWVDNQAFTTKDFVWYNNSIYLCIQNASAGTLPTNTDYYTRVIKGINPRGSWDANETYNMNDVIIFDGKAYWCKNNSVTSVPTTVVDWMEMPCGQLNAGFGIGNRFVLNNPDNDLLALWNLFHNNEIDGQMTLYGMTLRNNDYAVPIITRNAIYHDCTMKYCYSQASSDGQKDNDSGIAVNIPSLVMNTVGVERTIRILFFANANSQRDSTYWRFIAPSRVSSDFPDSNTYGLQFGYGGYYAWSSLGSTSTYDLFEISSYNGQNLYTLFNWWGLNEYVVTLKRVSNGYEYQCFINGYKITSGTSTLNYNATVSDLFIGTTAGSSNRPNYDSRGVAQVEVYEGIKYTNDYTPEFKFYREPV